MVLKEKGRVSSKSKEIEYLWLRGPNHQWCKASPNLVERYAKFSICFATPYPFRGNNKNATIIIIFH